MVRKSHWFWVTVLLVAGCGGGDSTPATKKGGASPAAPPQGGTLRLWAPSGGPAELASVHESQRDMIHGVQQHLEGLTGAAETQIDFALDEEGKAVALRIRASQPLDLSTLQSVTTLISARLEGEGVTDATAALLKDADKLQTAWLLKTKISDTGMRNFAAGVKDLKVYATPITGAGLAHLQGLEDLMIGKRTGLKGADLRQLQSLAKLHSLHVVAATDEDLPPIAEIPSLDTLTLIHTKVTDAGVEHLRNHPSLTRLHLSGTGVTDEGLKAVATLPKLAQLSLNGTAVTDAGIELFKETVTLKELSFGDTKVSDQALAHLEGLPKLRVVDAVGSLVTEAAAKKLEAALPNTLVFVRADDRRGSPPGGDANPDGGS